VIRRESSRHFKRNVKFVLRTTVTSVEEHLENLGPIEHETVAHEFLSGWERNFYQTLRALLPLPYKQLSFLPWLDSFVKQGFVISERYFQVSVNCRSLGEIHSKKKASSIYDSTYA
jgi:hypothetical protein